MAGIDHAPPPFFKRGPAPLALLTFYLALSLALFVVDLRMRSLDLIRQAVSIVTDPVQRIAQTPGSVVDQGLAYVQGLDRLLRENETLRTSQLNTAPDLQRLAQLEQENARLRQLLAVSEREKARGQVAQILYTARDPFTQKIIINKGEQAGIKAGRPAIDETGLVGQVTRAFPFSAEISLITDKDQAVPVQVLRNGLRSVVFGQGRGQLELRFLPNNADVKVGDVLVTSGIDGLYLAGFPVARVVDVQRDTAYSFATIRCEPIAGVENHGEIMVLDEPKPRVDRPDDAARRPVLGEGAGRNRGRRAGREN